jgi:hypothetical protein
VFPHHTPPAPFNFDTPEFPGSLSFSLVLFSPFIDVTQQVACFPRNLLGFSSFIILILQKAMRNCQRRDDLFFAWNSPTNSAPNARQFITFTTVQNIIAVGFLYAPALDMVS